jgi:translation initiation factor IF-3
METEAALAMAREADLDLVEVAPQADPPVCRIMDYGKYKYEQAVKQRESRKRQSQVVVKEMKMRPKIDHHDYATKKGHVERFLHQGAKVKVTIMFRGREMVHPENGQRLLDRLSSELIEIAKVDTPPKLDGRNMTMVLSPLKEAVTQKAVQPPRQKRPRTQGQGSESEPEPEPELGPEQEQEQDEEESSDEKKRPVKITRAEGG